MPLRTIFIVMGLSLLAFTALASASDTTTSPIKTFELDGVKSLPERDLRAVLAPWIGRPLDAATLQHATAALEQHYLSHRLLARATLPPQDVTEGRVRIQITEGQLGKVVMVAPVESIRPETSQAMLDHYLGRDGLLRLDRLDEATSRLNAWPGLAAESSLASGAQAGEIDVQMKLAARRPWTATLRLDNEGARATGSARLLGDTQLVLPGGGGQTLGAGVAISEGSQQLRLDASTPLGLQGFSATAYGSALRYRLITPDFNALEVKGPSSSLGARLAWATQRSSAGSTDVALQLERRRFDNQALGVSLARYKLDVLSLSVSKQILQAQSRAVSSAELTLSLGRVDLAGSANEDTDAITQRTAGRYATARINLQHWQPISDSQSVSLRASLLAGSKNLDVSERLSATGATAVRAYPLGEAYGSRGALASIEWQFNLARQGHANTTLALFADAAALQQLKNANFADAPEHNDMTLAGVGAWAEWRPRTETALRLSIAQPIGARPNATVQGRNQDGSRIGTRVWASAQWNF